MAYVAQTEFPLDAPITARAVSWIDALGSCIRGFVQRRQGFASLDMLSDRHLRDIGLTRHDVAALGGATLPSAGGTDLMNIRHGRSGNW